MKSIHSSKPEGLIAIVALLLMAGAPAQAEQKLYDARPNELSVLSYNVNGLFPLLTQDNPRDRSPAIGWLANKYDVVLLQEDFEYHDIIAEEMEGSTAFRGNGMRYDLRLVAAKLITLPFWLLLPHFSPPYGSGLTVFVREYLPVPEEVTVRAYEVCNGWLGEKGNCWATKGFMRVRVRLSDGAEVDVWHTHLDAGPSEGSTTARGKQLEVFAEAVEELSADRAVIIGGDLNLGFYRPQDRELILTFRERLGLRDTGAGPQLPWWRERDHIMFRSGSKTTLTVQDAGEALEFVNQNRALSDHPALFARFLVEHAP